MLDDLLDEYDKNRYKPIIENPCIFMGFVIIIILLYIIDVTGITFINI